MANRHRHLHTLTHNWYTHSHTLYTLPVIHTLAHTSSKKC